MAGDKCTLTVTELNYRQSFPINIEVSTDRGHVHCEDFCSSYAIHVAVGGQTISVNDTTNKMHVDKNSTEDCQDVVSPKGINTDSPQTVYMHATVVLKSQSEFQTNLRNISFIRVWKAALPVRPLNRAYLFNEWLYEWVTRCHGVGFVISYSSSCAVFLSWVWRSL